MEVSVGVIFKLSPMERARGKHELTGPTLGGKETRREDADEHFEKSSTLQRVGGIDGSAPDRKGSEEF